MQDPVTSGPVASVGGSPVQSLRAYLTRLIWFCMGPLILLSAYLAIERLRDLKAERDNAATKLSQTIMNAVDGELNARIVALQLLATSPLVDEPARWNDLYADGQRFREIFDCHVIFADRNMAMLWNTRVPFGTPLPPLPRPRGTAAAPLALASGKPAVGDLFQGPVANRPLVAIAVPTGRPGRTTYLLLTTFEASRFQRELEEVSLPAGWSVTLHDSQGVAIAHAPVASQGREAADGSQQFATRSGLSAWSLTIEIPSQVRREPLLIAGAVLGLSILGASLVGLVGGVRASRRLGLLIETIGQEAHPQPSRRDMAEFARVRQQLDDVATQRSLAEATLRDSEARFRRLFDEAPVPQALVGADGIFTSLNRRFVEVFGYARQDLPTIDAWWLLAYPEKGRHDALKREWTAARQPGEAGRSEISPVERHITCKDGTVRDVMVSSIRIGAELLFSFFDVTERNRAQTAAHQGATLYQQTLDSMLEGCQIVGFDWRYLYVNAAALLQNRQSGADLIGRTMLETYPGIEATEAFALLSGCMADRTARHHEVYFVFPDGTGAWFDINVQPAPEGIAIFSVDISERKRAEDALRRVAAIVESSDDAIVGKTLNGEITSWNRGAEKLFGYSVAEAVGRSVQMLVPPERASEEPDILRRIARGESVDHLETVRVRKDGSRIDVSATISPIFDSGGRVVGASKIARDITERKLAQARLEAQLDRLSLLDQITSAIGQRQDLQSIYEAVLTRLGDRLPMDFCCVCEHDAALNVLRVLSIGPASKPFAAQLDLVEGSTIDIDANGLAHALHGELVHEPDVGASPFPFPRRMADVGLRSLVMAPLRSESRVFGLLIAARRGAGSVSSGECEFLRQLSDHVALAVQQAQLYSALQVAYDELRQTQQAVMQQERLRALGEMASGIAHDINNAISPVLLYTEALLERETQLSERGRGYLQTIARSIDDVAATVARLREFYRHREPELSLAWVHLNLMVDQVAELTQARWSDMPQQHGVFIRLERELEDALPDVRGVESEVREALINLVFNAVDAMPDGGVLTLRTRKQTSPASGKGPIQSFVDVEVSDTGIGMDEDTLRRCREPFFTTKGERGTGLGLAMVYGFAQRHGADLHIESAVGRGTTVRLTFAVAADTATALAESGPLLSIPTARLRILIVDDDPIVLKSVLDVLTADGHQVVSAGGGKEGVQAFRAAHSTAHAFDAVITDLGMPHTDGRQVAQAVKALSPHTPVILLTGWGQRLIADNDIPSCVDRVLGKPPKLRELRLALAELTRDNRGDEHGRQAEDPPADR